MSKTICYGMIGCGMMGQEHLRNIALLEGAEVRVIFEPDPEMAAKALSLAPQARLVGSIAELLESAPLDCLVITSPNFRHLEQLEEIGATRPLPVLVEKPLFTAPEDAARLAAFRDSYAAPVWVAMEYRYMPPIAAFLDEIEAATGGATMLTIREHRFPFLTKVGNWNRFNRYTGGTFVEKCCHFFDLMRLALGSEPVRVMASAPPAHNHVEEAGAPDILDAGYAIVEFASGARAMLELCMYAEGSRYQEEVSAVGPKGKIEALVPGPTRFWPDHLGAPPVPKLVISPRHPQGPVERALPVPPELLAAGDHNGSTFHQHEGFLALVRGAVAAPEVTLADGWAAVAIGQAVQRSIATGQAVSIDSHPWAASAR
ncbi:oxidoreductase [Thioclava dalianensis]|uniref:Oxidoreductase n=1 Tax=Thioclava dalianensis TaxID=1185766 RepID=A0A074TI34_9RHOB|nr:Gfo/Idh/MocA family oxidoreductase [Thioclava dalianensis]KEP71376.1 oxidoreductase [Thioclava dalianensis]SFM78609.1 Predicted dehydrogenase [Thioclava dalianensis]